MNAFGGLNGTLSVFSLERPLFLRERSNQTYAVSSYFWGKSLAEFPFQLLYPIISVIVCYWACGMNSYDSSKSGFQILNQMLTYWAGSAYGLMMSVFIQKVEVATALTPIIIIPLMLLGGFFMNTNDVPYVFYPLVYLSFFRYSYQAGCIIEFTNLDLGNCNNGLPCDPLNQL